MPWSYTNYSNDGQAFHDDDLHLISSRSRWRSSRGGEACSTGMETPVIMNQSQQSWNFSSSIQSQVPGDGINVNGDAENNFGPSLTHRMDDGNYVLDGNSNLIVGQTMNQVSQRFPSHRAGLSQYDEFNDEHVQINVDKYLMLYPPQYSSRDQDQSLRCPKVPPMDKVLAHPRLHTGFSPADQYQRLDQDNIHPLAGVQILSTSSIWPYGCHSSSGSWEQDAYAFNAYLSSSASIQHEPLAAHKQSSYSELSANLPYLSNFAGPKKKDVALAVLTSKSTANSSRNYDDHYPPLERNRGDHPTEIIAQPTKTTEGVHSPIIPPSEPLPRLLGWVPPTVNNNVVPESSNMPPLKNVKLRKNVETRRLSLACLFCRERKIACGRPAEDLADQTCNQCARRLYKCEYPTQTRRGQRRSEKKKKRIQRQDVGCSK